MTETTCPGCGLKLLSDEAGLDLRYNASIACRRLYDELSAFTLSSGDKDFIHQLAVDAYAAQHSGPQVKPISIAFALIGPFLVFERGYTGRQVQLAHMALAKTRRQWPLFNRPITKARLTIFDALAGLTAQNYQAQIKSWAESVWEVWHSEHQAVSRLLDELLYP